MAKCDVCNREMNAAAGCKASGLQFTPYKRPLLDVELDGIATGKLKHEPFCDPSRREQFARIPYGQGNRHASDGMNCHDCNAKPGRFHHPGCDNEECPRCHGQLISCVCNEGGLFADVLPEPKKGGKR